jgi:quercetin dioxygenase-like cupin family protein
VRRLCAKCFAADITSINSDSCDPDLIADGDRAAVEDVRPEPASMDERTKQARTGEPLKVCAWFSQASADAFDRTDLEPVPDEAGVRRPPHRRRTDRGEHVGSRAWQQALAVSHTHHANEEWAIVLRGEPTLRTPEGEQVLKEGDVVCFPRGKEGAHQIINGTDSPIRVLMLSSMIGPDIVEYLDTGKVYATSVEGEPIMLARPGPTAEYWEGEE